MPTKIITFKYKRPASPSRTPTPAPSNPHTLTEQLTNAKESLEKTHSKKQASFLEIYLPSNNPNSPLVTHLRSMEQYNQITQDSEQQWKRDAYEIVDILKSWRSLFKSLDHRKRYLRRLKKDASLSNGAENNGIGEIGSTNVTPETEMGEHPEEGSLEDEDEEGQNSEQREDTPEAVELRRKRRRVG